MSIYHTHKMLCPKIFAFFLLAAWESRLVSGQLHFMKGAPHVQLANGGLLSGTVKFSRDGRPYSSFIGIPYGKVPARFQEAEPLLEPSWQGILSATKPGEMCPQGGFADENTLFGDEENCLNLNVYVPMNNTGTGKRGYPVMFWVHGGGYMFGEGLQYGPRLFMDEDVILVTINYRVGAFGFLSTGDGVIPGNNGLKDMVLALKWVQENIQKFGGNQNLVSIFGESAGGSAVNYLMLSPTTKGLFHRAISQSGSAFHKWSFDPNPKAVATDLATHLNCPTTASQPSDITSEEILTCLKGLSTEELNRAQFAFKTSWPLQLRSFYFSPSVEPIGPRTTTLTPFLTEAPVLMLSRKDSTLPEIPWMVGATEDEGAPMYSHLIFQHQNLLKELNSDWEKIAPSTFDYRNYLSTNDERNQVSEKLKQFYFGGNEISEETGRDSLTNLYSDDMILHGVYKSALETASRGKGYPVYLYQYAYLGPVSLMGGAFQIKGLETKVGHGDEIQHLFHFIFPGVEEDDLTKLDPRHEEFSKNLIRLWVSFAIHGEPKHFWGTATLKKWKPISKKELDGVHPLRWYRIDENPASVEISQSVKDRMTFWDNLWSEHFTPVVMARNAAQTPPQKTEL